MRSPIYSMALRRLIKLLFCTVLLISATEKVHSQNASRTITGLVISADDLQPVEGVAIAVKGNTKITSGTQSDGIYFINVPAQDSVLVFSSQEFQTLEIKISSSKEYNITLKRKNNVTESAIIEAPVPFSPFGNWRGTFFIRKDTEVPFNFEITGSTLTNAKVYFINGHERFDGGSIKLSADSLFIEIDQFGNELALKINADKLTGILQRQDKSGSAIPVNIERGLTYRFKEPAVKPAGDISGTYDIIFKSDNGKEEKAVGLFKQQGNKLSATFLKVTGDSRFLEGITEGNHFYLSSFIGSSPAYYTGTFSNDGKLSGQLIGSRSEFPFTGILNENATLPDLYKLTFLKDGYSSLDFSFPDLDGKPVSLKDAKFKDKVIVLTIGGTWCPNCIDETAFLSPWYKENKKRGIEIISLQYERKNDTAYSRKAIKWFRDKFDIQYQQLFAGLADKQFVAESLPALNTFLAFPTTIFIDKKGKVDKIHTGFTGPATGKYYEEFIKEFNDEVSLLLKK